MPVSPERGQNKPCCCAKLMHTILQMIVAFSSSAAQSACHDFERHDKDSSVSKASEVRQGSVRRARCMSSDVEVVDARDDSGGGRAPFGALLAVASPWFRGEVPTIGQRAERGACVCRNLGQHDVDVA